MNWEHLKTISWLRWRLSVNQFRKIGKGHRWFSILILCAAVLFASLMAWVGCFARMPFLDKAPPSTFLLIWAGIATTYLFTWSIGVLTDLQKKEPLTLNKFLHLPLSPANAFFANFLSSFVSFSNVLVLPAMLGFTARMVTLLGWRMSACFLLLFAFFLMVMALTYQVRSWLGAIMLDKRKRRSVLSIATISFILIVQIPNLINISIQSTKTTIPDAPNENQLATDKKPVNELLDKSRPEPNIHTNKVKEPPGMVGDKEIPTQESTARTDPTLVPPIDTARLTAIKNYVRIACVIIPFGWLALGVESMANGNSLLDYGVALFCICGMLVITVLSLKQSYHSTLRLYRGDTKQKNQNEPPTGKASRETPSWSERLIWRSFPFLSPHQSAIAGSALLGLVRAPEAKMVLLSPFLVVALVGGSLAYRNADLIEPIYRSLGGIGAVTFGMIGIMHLTNNQFGYDRQGFRCLLLCPVRRRDILIGKNMALAPFALLVGVSATVLIQIFTPMAISHCLATLVQIGTIYLVSCLVGNLMSIKAPIAIHAGTMRPNNINLSVATLQILLTLLLPIGLFPTLIPLLTEVAVQYFWKQTTIPIYLLLSVTLFAFTIWVYRLVISRQAEMLQACEIKILEAVTKIG